MCSINDGLGTTFPVAYRLIRQKEHVWGILILGLEWQKTQGQMKMDSGLDNILPGTRV